MSDQSLFESPSFPEPEDDLDDDDLEEQELDEEEPLGEGSPRASGATDLDQVAGGRARSVLEHVAASIVDDPDAVHVEVERGRSGLLLSLSVGPSDMGRVIGKRGRVAQAMRTLVRAAAARDDTDATVDIVD